MFPGASPGDQNWNCGQKGGQVTMLLAENPFLIVFALFMSRASVSLCLFLGCAFALSCPF